MGLLNMCAFLGDKFVWQFVELLYSTGHTIRRNILTI
jgi:hypothetical protein